MRRLAVLLAIAALALDPSDADGHEGAGTLTLLEAEPVAALQVRYRVRLVFTADGHPVQTATVTAVPTDAAGKSMTPVVLAAGSEEGAFEGTVQYPEAGPWTIRFTAVSPAATLEHVEQVAAPPTTTPTTVAPAAETDDGGAPRSGDGLPLELVLGVACAAVVAAWLIRRLRHS